ncbi:metal ABC transporter solute-binding protein, Zn/Mn family [Bifidobacterium stellenboschense]|uniref:ABC transporter substrate-binding protein n=1 Tax=Bifidobacterium stellenboschense TaxID=762211 RepID=A0A087DZQ8_9BIFI|nr:zinc ABC transporter substrate-binding protein [Bifidobacterium stellenboschense]KFJ01009.1 ABC transporter substrate-binding protein [Bifidobacterium stellenboschense]
MNVGQLGRRSGRWSGRRFGNARRVAAAVAAAAVALACAACGTAAGDGGTTGAAQTTTEKTGVIKVVSSVNQWGSLAKEIGGDAVDVTSILSSTGVDAHDFEPKTSDLAKLSRAEIVVANGAGYDTWATKSRGPDSTLVSAAQIVGAMDGDNPHLWFSKDARAGMAKELADVFSKARPKKRKAFAANLKAWQSREKELDARMADFADTHKDLTYGATEAVVYYLMSDMSFDDVTPKGYAQAVANGGEVAPADLQTFQEVIEKKRADVLVNNTQEASDATNMLIGTAGRSDVPVVDVSEQMPEKYDTLVDWIGALAESIFTAVDPDYGKDDTTGGCAADGDDPAGSSDSTNSTDEHTGDGNATDDTGKTTCDATDGGTGSSASDSSDGSDGSGAAGADAGGTQPDPGK